MGFRLKTSKKTKEIFDQVGSSSNLKPFALCKIAIALSINNPSPLQEIEDDQLGLELQRQTVTGELDAVYKCLMENHANQHLSDEDYFPHHTKRHIDRGAQLLSDTYKYGGGNLEKFINQLIVKGVDSI